MRDSANFHSVSIGHRATLQLGVSKNGLFESCPRFKGSADSKQAEAQRDMGDNSRGWIGGINHSLLKLPPDGGRLGVIGPRVVEQPSLPEDRREGALVADLPT